MVDVEGDLRPFRIDMHNFIDLVSHISEKLDDVHSPVRDIDIKVERFRKSCANVDDMIAFLKDIHIPRVAKYLTVWIYGKTGIKILLYFSSESAKYDISDAEDMNQVRSIEDTITEFFKKHATSRFFSPFVGICLSATLFVVALIAILEVAASYLHGSVVAYRPLVLLAGICAAALLVYIAWSALTAESPPISFVHSIIYMDKRSNYSMWILISTILIGIVVSVISNWFG